MIYIKHLLIGLVASLLLFSSCKTKSVVSSDDIQSEINKNKRLANALLWKIEGNELSTASYLYGTIHMIDADDYFLPTGTLAAMEAVEKVVFEIDMNEMSDMSNMMGIMMKAFMKDGLTLKDLLSEADYKVVGDHFQKIGLPLMMLERIKPMFLSALAYGDMDPEGLQTGSIKSYEMEFFEIAESAGKSVAGLETIEFQMGLFDSIPYKDQAEMLVETIKHSDTESDEFEKMTAMYKAQDITAMIEMVTDETEQLSEHEDLLVGKRNSSWIPIMEKMMKVQPTFFAVGAAHLAGEKGVINLMKKAGYKVTPISNTSKK